METKICSKCKVEKPLEEYRKFGKYYRSECKKCACLYSQKYRAMHNEQVKEKAKLYRIKNKEKIKLMNKESHKKNYEKNKEQLKKKSRDYYYKNKEAIKEKQKIYREKNKDKIKESNKEYYKKNKNKLIEYQRKHNIEKRKENPKFKLKGQIRHMIFMSFNKKNKRKSRKLEQIVKCDINYLIDYLIKTYEKNYNEKWDWEYVKEIHIDHIKPLATAKTEEDIIELCHYTNLQLLKANDNLAKGSKLNWELKVKNVK